MGTTSSRQSPDQTLQDTCHNLENIEQYVTVHRDQLTPSDKRKLEDYLHFFHKQLKKLKTKSPLLPDAFHKLDQLRTELKSIHNPPTSTYTLPRVDDLVNLFENNNSSFRRASKKPGKRSSSSSSKKTKVKSSYEILKELNAIEVEIKTKSLSREEVDAFQKLLIDHAKQLPSRTRSPEVDKIFRTISTLQKQLHELTEDEDDGATTETNSFTVHKYPPSLLEIFSRLKSDLNLLKSYDLSCAEHLPEAIAAVEDLERFIKSLKKQLYAENFKWKRSKAEKLAHNLQELEDEINRCDIVAVAREKGKEHASDLLRTFSNKISGVETGVTPEIDRKKSELSELVKKIAAFMNDTFVETALAKMETDHNKFKQQIINFSDSEQSSNYKNFMGYLLQLKKYTLKLGSDDPQLRARKEQVVGEINRSMKILKHKAVKFDQIQAGKNTAEKQLVVLLKLLKTYSGSIERISAAVKNGEEVEEEKLEQIRNSLLSLNIPAESVSCARKRESSLETIEKLLNFARGDEEVVVRKLGSLKKKVRTFSGSYKNVYYKSIEKELQGVLKELPEGEKTLRGEVLHNLKILEEKSQKDTGYGEDETRRTLTLVRNKIQSVRDSLNDPGKELEFCYEKLDNLMSHDEEVQREKLELFKEIKEVSSSVSEEIKKKALQFNSNKKVKADSNEVKKIREELEEVKGKIVAVDGRDAEEVLRVREGIERCYGLLSGLKEPSLVEERSALYKDIGYWNEVLSKKSASSASSGSLEEVERRLNGVRRGVEVFVGDESSEKYRELDDELIGMTLQLDKCRFEKGSEGFVARRKLMREIQEVSDSLEERLEKCEGVEEVGRGVNVLMIKLDGLSNKLEQENVESLRDELEGLYGRVGVFEEEEKGALGERCREVLGNLESCKEKLEQLLLVE